MLPVINKRNGSLLNQRDLFGDFESLLDNFWPGQSQLTNMIGSLDVYEDKKSIHVDCDLPGFTKEELDISLEDDILRIAAEHKEQRKEERAEDSYYLRERRCSAFSRSVKLPHNIMHDKVTAEYNDGVLKITVEKQPEKQPQSIKIK